MAARFTLILIIFFIIINVIIVVIPGAKTIVVVEVAQLLDLDLVTNTLARLLKTLP
jgi:hypothetical protein